MLGDRGRLLQVLTHLADNAVKFTERGSVVLRAVRAPAATDGVVAVRYEVVDTGIGMAEETIAKLFMPFTQADSSDTRQHDGLGLGLPICTQLTRLMGGELQVRSEPGRGTTFSLILEHTMAEQRGPEMSVDVAHVAVASDPAVAPAATTPEQLTPILVAEDNRINQVVIRRQLESLGYEAQLADDGVQALAAWRRGRYALLLTDCQMPHMDGYQLTRAIREEERSSQAASRTAIVAITANAAIGETEECLRAGMDDFLSKPLELRKLEQVLVHWLKAA